MNIKEVIKKDKLLYREKNIKKRIFFYMTKNPKIYILKYLILCRKHIFFKLKKRNLLENMYFVYITYRKNKLGTKINLELNCNELGENIMIYHRNVVINPNAKIGNNCKFHGNNCIGNNGKNSKAPNIGINVDVGFGASIIGDIYIANNIIIGANSVVTKSFYEEGITIAGVPAKKII